jgi:hypothetical protein
VGIAAFAVTIAVRAVGTTAVAVGIAVRAERPNARDLGVERSRLVAKYGGEPAKCGP